MTIDECNADIALYMAARNAILTRGVQSYEVLGKSLTALDLKFIEDKLTTLRQARDAAAAGMFQVAQNRRPE